MLKECWIVYFLLILGGGRKFVLDLSAIIERQSVPEENGRYCQERQMFIASVFIIHLQIGYGQLHRIIKSVDEDVFVTSVLYLYCTQYLFLVESYKRKYVEQVCRKGVCIWKLKN